MDTRIKMYIANLSEMERLNFYEYLEKKVHFLVVKARNEEDDEVIRNLNDELDFIASLNATDYIMKYQFKVFDDSGKKSWWYEHR